jgi:hypothetical protein
VADPDAIWVGDTVSITWDTKSAAFKVTGQTETEFQLTYVGENELDTSIFSADEWTMNNTQPSNWVDSVGTKVLTVTSDATVASVTNELVAIMRGEELGYGYANILGDIAKDSTGKLIVSEDKKTIKLAPGGALEFVTDDIVAITRASVDLEVEATEDSGLDTDNILWLGKVKQSDPITDTVEFYDEIDSSLLPTEATELNFQLLNLTQTNKVVYASTDTCKRPATMTVSDVKYTYKKKSDGKDAVAAVYEITTVTGKVTDTVTGGETVVVTYDDKTASGAVDAEGNFSANFTDKPTTSEAQPTCNIQQGTIDGSTVTISGAAFVTALKTPAEEAVMPVYTITAIDVTATSTAKYMRVGDQATATVTAIDESRVGEVEAGAVPERSCMMTDRKIENVLREALEAEPPAAADLRLRAAIGFDAASRRHRRQTRRWWAAAACLAVFLGVAGLLQFQRYSARREAKLQEAGEIMLEIIGMAAADEFYATLET